MSRIAAAPGASNLTLAGNCTVPSLPTVKILTPPPSWLAINSCEEDSSRRKYRGNLPPLEHRPQNVSSEPSAPSEYHAISSVPRTHVYNILYCSDTWRCAVRIVGPLHSVVLIQETTETSVYKGYKQDKIEMRGDRAEMSDFPLYLNMVAGGLDRRDQTIGGFSFVVKIYAVPVVEIII